MYCWTGIWEKLKVVEMLHMAVIPTKEGSAGLGYKKE